MRNPSALVFPISSIFATMPHARRIGSDAEDLAAEFLLNQGYTLLTRRFKAGRGEIDLVALDGETLVFVEVKLRQGRWFSATEAVTPQKKGRIVSASQAYLERYDGPERPVRYDVVAIDSAGVQHHVAAFEPE